MCVEVVEDKLGGWYLDMQTKTMKTALFLVGTNASGKSTLARTLLREHFRDAREKANERGKIVAHEGRVGQQRLALLGRYLEGGPQCAGLDALAQGAEEMFQFIREQLDECPVVLLEGARICNGKRTAELINEGIRVIILELVVPDEEIIRSLTERRAAKGQGPLDDTRHVFLNKKRARAFAANMYSVGATTKKVTRETAIAEILNILQNF